LDPLIIDNELTCGTSLVEWIGLLLVGGPSCAAPFHRGSDPLGRGVGARYQYADFGLDRRQLEAAVRLAAAVVLSSLGLVLAACTSSPGHSQASPSPHGLIAGTLLGRNGATAANPHGLHGIAGQVFYSASGQIMAPEPVSSSGLFRAAVNVGDYKLRARPASPSYADCRAAPARLHVTGGAIVRVRIICRLKGIRLVAGR
jgi:hypothetical protein